MTTSMPPGRPISGSGHETKVAGPGPTVIALKLARRRKGISETVLAWELRVSKRTIQSWEEGSRKPSSARLEAWADALGLRLVLVPKETP